LFVEEDESRPPPAIKARTATAASAANRERQDKSGSSGYDSRRSSEYSGSGPSSGDEQVPSHSHRDALSPSCPASLSTILEGKVDLSVPRPVWPIGDDAAAVGLRYQCGMSPSAVLHELSRTLQRSSSSTEDVLWDISRRVQRSLAALEGAASPPPAPAFRRFSGLPRLPSSRRPPPSGPKQASAPRTDSDGDYVPRTSSSGESSSGYSDLNVTSCSSAASSPEARVFGLRGSSAAAAGYEKLTTSGSASGNDTTTTVAWGVFCSDGTSTSVTKNSYVSNILHCLKI